MDGLTELLTPICKAYASDMSYDVCEQAIQVHGGYGYCAEYPVEQFARDCKIASIYEGTNAIQAIDLLSRKVLRTRGQSVNWLMDEVMPMVERAAGIPDLADMAALVRRSLVWLQDGLGHLASLIGKGELEAGLLEATPMLEIFGDVLLGWFWLWQAEVAHGKLETLRGETDAPSAADARTLAEKSPEAAFLHGKLVTARYYVLRLLPLVEGKVAALKVTETGPLDMPEVCF